MSPLTSPDHRLGILDLLAHEAEVRPDERVAVVDDGAELSYRELFDRARRLAAGLRAAGVRPGDVVGVLAPERDWLEFLVAGYGVYLAEAILAPMSPRLGPAGVAAALEACNGIGTVVTTSEPGFAVDVASVLPAAALRAGDPIGTVPRTAPDAAACVVFTSGSTGAPRAVVSSWANLDFDHANTPRPRDRGRRRFLTVPSVGSAVAQSLLHDSACGPEFVVATGPDPEKLAALIAQHRPQVVGLVPALAAVLVDQLEASSVDTDSVELVVCGSAPLPPSLFDRLGRSFRRARVFNSYGLTEGGVLVSQLGVDPVGSVGRPADGVQIRIEGPDGEDAAPGTVGQLLIRERGKPPRGELAATPDAPSHDPAGWVRTGDRALVDRDGYVFLQGRIDELVDVSGTNVSLTQVESALAAQPAVSLAGVAGVPHPVLGHRLVGFCQTRHAVEPAELMAAANAILPRTAALQAVYVLDALPLSVNRKLDRPALRRLAEERAFSAEEASGGLHELVLSAWRRALARPDLRPDEELAIAGGHSLLAVEVALSIGRELDRRVPVATALGSRTARELAERIAAALAAGELAPRVVITRRRS